jgi:hypothetical protein
MTNRSKRPARRLAAGGGHQAAFPKRSRSVPATRVGAHAAGPPLANGRVTPATHGLDTAKGTDCLPSVSGGTACSRASMVWWIRGIIGRSVPTGRGVTRDRFCGWRGTRWSAASAGQAEGQQGRLAVVSCLAAAGSTRKIATFCTRIAPGPAGSVGPPQSAGPWACPRAAPWPGGRQGPPTEKGPRCRGDPRSLPILPGKGSKVAATARRRWRPRPVAPTGTCCAARPTDEVHHDVAYRPGLRRRCGHP